MRHRSIRIADVEVKLTEPPAYACVPGIHSQRCQKRRNRQIAAILLNERLRQAEALGNIDR
jgi:hypothetical protein